MLEKEDVRHVAQLARMKLTEAEEEQFQEELSSMLDFVEQLQKVDVTDTPPMHHAVPLVNALRKDALDEKKEKDADRGKRLIEQAPEHKDRQAKVPGVFNS